MRAHEPAVDPAEVLFAPGEGRIIHDALRRAVAAEPSRPVLGFIDDTGSAVRWHTRAQLWDLAADVAGGLRRAGIDRQARVAMFIGNRVEIVAAWFACSMLDAVAVPLNTALRGVLMDHELQVTQPQVLLVEQSLLPQIAASVHTASWIEHVVVIPPGPGDVAAVPAAAEASDMWDARFVTLADFLDGDPLGEPVEVLTQSTSTIIFTSGTTGRSKGVMLTHRMAFSEADAIRWVMGYRPSDTAFTCLPLFHGNALLCSFFPALLAGASCVVARRFSASNLWRQVAISGATTINLLGSMSTILWRQPVRPDERNHRLRLALAVPSPLEHYDEFEQRFDLRLTEFYGLTDSQIPLGIPFGERRPGSCGKPTPDWQVALVDAEDEEVPTGAVGELVLRPKVPFVGFSGYWANDQASHAVCRNQWFHTGDLMRRDDQGWFYFVDRAKDVIRRRGENVSSFEVEEVLLDHPMVMEAAVYAVPSDMLEDEVMAAAILRAGHRPDDLRALLEHCEHRLPYFAVPRYYRVVDDFPRTENHKIRKEALRADGVTNDAWDAGDRALSRRADATGQS